MSDLHLFVFSKGRVGRQRTLMYLPDEIKANHLTFITPKSEVADHKAQPYGQGLDYLKVPDGTHLGDKRLLIAKHVAQQGFKKFLFLDDDLALTIYDKPNDKFRSTRVFEDQSAVTKLLTRHASKILDKYEGMSFGCLTMQAKQDVQKEGKLQVLNTKSACIFGYQVDYLLEFADDPRFQSLWGVDTTWNLEVLQRGGQLCTDYHLSWQAEFDAAKNGGGATTYRTPQAVNLSFLRMMLLHPGLISRGKTGAHIHSFLKIAWRNAREPENAKRLAIGLQRFDEELSFQGLSTRDFLQQLPEASRPYYQKRCKLLLNSAPASLF